LQHSSLLTQYLPQLKSLHRNSQTTVLDLACGNGRNGLYLVENDIAVTFADINSAAIEQLKQHASKDEHQQFMDFWSVDFEQEANMPLANKHFAAIMVFRYLHRSLFDQIKQAILPGGLIIYETFTTDQIQFGRPKNPDFLLNSGELLNVFSGWEILHNFEGIIESTSGSKQAIAQIVAQKPMLIE